MADRPAFDAPFRLPSGETVHVRMTPPSRPIAEDAEPGGKPLFGGRLLRAVADGHVEIRRAGEAVDLDRLPLADFHALRDLAERASVIAIPEDAFEGIRCRNCEAPLDPGLGPLDGMSTWYEDEGAPPEELRHGEVTMEPVSFKRARPLLRAVLSGDEPPITPRLVRALGLRALGSAREPAAVARRLDRAPGSVWALVEAMFVRLNYASRGFHPLVCPACGAVNEIHAPAVAEFDVEPEADASLDGLPPPAVPDGAVFPSRETFEDLVERIGGEVYRARGVQNIVLQVSFGVAPVDGSGEPLLGDYQPQVRAEGEPGYAPVEFVITLHYTTFRRMWDEDGPYDVEEEIRDTIDHEVEHHLYHLDGHDPMDDEEREEAKRDLVRTFGRERVQRAAAEEAIGHARRLGLLFLVVVAAVALTVLVLHLTDRL